MNPEQDVMEPIREIVRRQPWYKETAKAVTGGVGALISIIWLGATLGLNIPTEIEKWGFVVISVLTMLGVYEVPSGITQSQYDQIKEAYTGRHRRPDV